MIGIGRGGASPLGMALLVSLVRLVIGYALTVLVGALIGLCMWRWDEVDRLLGPVLLGLQALPSVCWVPLALLLPGLGPTERGVIFVTVMGSTFAIGLSMRDGLRSIPSAYQRSGLMLGASGWKLYRYVLFPSSLPALTTSLRLGFSFAWRSLMGAEVLFAASRLGLGNLLAAAKSDVARVIAVMAIMVIVGALADRWIFAKLQVAVHRRFGLA
jgi:NitT/TauT family transport system permease protein